MKKIYIRAGLSPLENKKASELLMGNTIGSNIGNLVYAYSIFRHLTVDEHTEIVPNRYKMMYSQKLIDNLNENYDAFVIPLADAFRENFMGELRTLTALVKSLKIPCIVDGVGLKASLDNTNFQHAFDDDVKNFMDAILEKSALVGVRGEITGQYLNHLGYKAEKHYTVIGCPSLYTFGKELTVRDTKLTKDSRISVNNTILGPEKVQKFLDRSMEMIPDHYFLPQTLQELSLCYLGIPYQHTNRKRNKTYPCKITDSVYREDRARFATNVLTWSEFLKTMDFSIGGRLHGNVVGIISGTPSLLIPKDARMKELVEYHNLPHVWAKDVDEHTDIFDLFEKTDFHSVTKGHAQRFEHYIDFLDANGLDHIYKNGANPQEAPLDKKMKQLDLPPMIPTINGISLEEKAARYDEYFPMKCKEEMMQKKTIAKLKSENKKLKAEVAKANASMSERVIRKLKSLKKK